MTKQIKVQPVDEHRGQLLELYAVYDRKSLTYMRPMYVAHMIEIQRILIQNLKQDNSIIGQFPEDYEVYKLGTFNLSTAEYIILPKPVFMFNITELMESPTSTRKEPSL